MRGINEYKEAAKIRSEAENCKEKSDCVEEAGAEITKSLDEFADTMTDLGRDANAMVQGVTAMTEAMDKLKAATHVGELGCAEEETALKDGYRVARRHRIQVAHL